MDAETGIIILAVVIQVELIIINHLIYRTIDRTVDLIGHTIETSGKVFDKFENRISELEKKVR